MKINFENIMRRAIQAEREAIEHDQAGFPWLARIRQQDARALRAWAKTLSERYPL